MYQCHGQIRLRMRIVKVALSSFPGTQTSKFRDFLKFEILTMLIDYKILWMKNTVEMAGGWHKYDPTLEKVVLAASYIK